MDNILSQAEEIVALQSIFDEKELIIEDENPYRGRFLVGVQLPSEFIVTCSSDEPTLCSRNAYFNVEFLPPITLTFELPPTYPSESSPAFLVSCSWLNLIQISKLCKRLDCISKENSGEVILFHWMCFLQSEVLSFLGITDNLNITELSSYNLNSNLQGRCHNSNSNEPVPFDENRDLVAAFVKSAEPKISGGTGSIDSRAFLDLVNGNKLFSNLQHYDKCKKDQIFETTLVTCEICYSSKLGYSFTKFEDCGHSFCVECITSYFEIQIGEGNVHGLNCPELGCKSKAGVSQVKSLVKKELYDKYDVLLLSRSLENMKDVVFCPRKVCQAPLIIENETTMGWCNKCDFVFCLFCRMTHHGVAPCRLKWEEQKQIFEKYRAAHGNEKLEMERRYGKKALQFLVENTLSEAWVTSFSKRCPHCKTHIEKNEGCNKMTCSKCGIYFCWLCMTQLPEANPYRHFSDPTVRCYNQLFPEDYDDAQPGEYLEF